jgi:hypothetical protein
MAHLEFSIGKNETENVPHFIGNKVFLWKIIWSFQHDWSFEAPLLRRTSSAVSPTGNRHGPLGIQFIKKKFKRSVMFKWSSHTHCQFLALSLRQTVKNIWFSFLICLVGIYEKVSAKFALILTRNKI